MRADLKGICEAEVKELGERLNEEVRTMSAMSSSVWLEENSDLDPSGGQAYLEGWFLPLKY